MHDDPNLQGDAGDQCLLAGALRDFGHTRWSCLACFFEGLGAELSVFQVHSASTGDWLVVVMSIEVNAYETDV